MFNKEVTTKDGVIKTIIAGSQEELDEAVGIIKNDEAPYQPDINDPEDGNMVVSPDNTHAGQEEVINTHTEVNTDPVGQVEEEKVDVKVVKK